MRAIEINQHLNGLIPDLPANTVDRVIYGDPEAEVRGIAVAWMPYRKTVEQARATGASVLVVHEPTFYDHWDLQGKNVGLSGVEEKKRLITEGGITIIRCHDVWDAMPEIGIPFAWGRFLELGTPTRSVRHYNLYSVAPQPAMSIAKRIAEKTASFGQPMVGFYGDPNRTVATVGVGTGCISDPFTLYNLGADLAVSVDDVVRAWIAGEWCQDSGNPLVVVNHCVSEEPGMATLAEYLTKSFPGIKVTHLRQGCTYRTVEGR
jgi:putative NIF3 family GTP cyclohydrolase 1 type 2